MDIQVTEVEPDFKPVKIVINITTREDMEQVWSGGQHMKMEVGDIVVSAVRKFEQEREEKGDEV